MHLSREQRRVVDRIALLVEKRRPLNISAVRESHPDLLLSAYSSKPFLGWKQAVEATGVEYGKTRHSVPKTIKCRICGAKRKKLHQHVRYHHKMSAGEYLQRYRGATMSSPAVRLLHAESKNVIIPHWEPHWSPEYVLDRLCAFDRMGIPLNPSNIEKMEGLCYRWGLHFFKNWDIVLKALQMDPQAVRKAARKKMWTKAHLLKEVRRLKILGHDVNWTTMSKHDRSITWAAIRIYGSYDGMLRAAGLDPKVIRKAPKPKNKYKTEADITNALCRRKLRELPINTNGVTRGENRNLSLYNRGRRVFGTWGAAVKAAGFDYNKVSRRGNPYNTRKKTVAEIRRRHEDGLPLKVGDVRYGKHKDGQLHTAALKFFKSWGNALDKAGISREKVYPSRARYVSKDSVIAGIRRRDKEGLGLCSSILYHGEHSDMALYMRARRLFPGGWAEAVTLAGIDYKRTTGPISKYPSGKAVVTQIRRRRKCKLPLNAVAVSAGQNSDSALYNSGRKEFGSWQNAIEAAGIGYETVTLASRYPTKASILAAIQQRHASGLPLNFKAIVKGEDTDAPLHARCVREFGGWRQAIEEAGIDYDSVRLPRVKYPDKGSVMLGIRARKKAGLSLTYNDVERGKTADRPLMLAASREFGSWKVAVSAMN